MIDLARDYHSSKRRSITFPNEIYSESSAFVSTAVYPSGQFLASMMYDYV